MKKLKLVRKYGPLPVLTKKVPGLKKKDTPPGQHGNNIRRKQSQYAIRLVEKQKLRYNYALTEHQFVKYVKDAKRSKQLTGHALLQSLENRLDTCVYRAGFASTIVAARQLVSHKHIRVNGKVLNIPSYQCQTGDELQATLAAVAGPGRVVVTRAEENRPQIELDLNERLVVEYYSRK